MLEPLPKAQAHLLLADQAGLEVLNDQGTWVDAPPLTVDGEELYMINVGDMLEGFRRISALADSPQLVIPGHDPQVLQRFHPASRDQEGWIARLDTGMR